MIYECLGDQFDTRDFEDFQPCSYCNPIVLLHSEFKVNTEPLPCPHDDCHYRDSLVDNKPGVWLRINTDDARAMVDAVENNHPHRAMRIIKRQPWYPSLKATDPAMAGPPDLGGRYYD
jgi:hypothetical protein